MNRTKWKNRCLLATCITFFWCAPARSVLADIYSYVDSQGVVHFTNVPTSPRYKVYIKERPPAGYRAYIPSRYDHLIAAASKKHGISFSLLKALIKTESDFNRWAVSRDGAKGLMQIMPENIKTLRIKDPFDPRENIMAGSRYLKQMLERFDGKVHLALAAYNAGPNAVERYRRIPPFKETEEFVDKVLRFYSFFKNG